MGSTVKVRLLGVFRKALGKESLQVKVERPLSAIHLILKVAEFSPELKRVLIDPELGDPRPNALILINGREISALDGLETLIKGGDEVVLIPVTHGG
ncbi:MAG: molybdopterin converting factor [Candidatus Bathyarchaeota archaeon B26-1]|nr:MAG: molybdopterin converting factor [Candidatus Bathyarchaeota archaeon B26-1]